MQKLSFFKKLFDFFIFSNLFIAFCAVIMVTYTWYLFHISKQFVFLEFIFCATLASYNLHWFLTNASKEITAERSQWLFSNKNIHFAFFISSAIATLWLFIRLSAYWLAILPLFILTFLYTAPKFPHTFFKALEKNIIGKTFLLTLVWTYATTALPMLIIPEQWSWQNALFSIHRFTLIFPICILFDIRDKHDDKKTGIKSIVTLLSEEKIRLIFNIFIILHILSSLTFFYTSESISLLITFLAPSIITYLLYIRAIKSTNAYLFYFILDGLMILSPVCYFIIDLASYI